MKKTTVPFQEGLIEIDRNVPVAFLGSCFSEHLSHRLGQNRFNVVSNPLGIIFNPMSIAQFLEFETEALLENNFSRNDVWLNWQANATVFGYSNDELSGIIRANQGRFREGLLASNVLFITFGTAWVYEQITNGTIVANCHKQPSKDFRKRLLTVEEIVAQWSKVITRLNEVAPELSIVFTVSPVRHTKDGMVENMWGKARLLDAIHQLEISNSHVKYFPVFEFFMDELRDYAYYEKDGIHPNSIALDLVWQKFEQSFFNEKTKSWLKEYQRLAQQLQHRPLHPDSKEAKEFVAKAQREMDEFLDK